MRISVVVSVLALSFAGSAYSDDVDFAREVLPILSDKCFVCHGPDAATDDGTLRLDSLEAATTDLGGYQAVNPSNPSESELLKRIQSVDDPMPPTDAEKQLSDDERQILAKWIEQGGSYAKHWAFVPPMKKGDLNSIDQFIERDLRKNGFQFAPRAGRAVLGRRLSLTLTGLPPEPAQLRQYMEGDSEAAYDALLNQLLESPRYGEHQARYWLDAVRYGDTHGLHLDNRRGIFPYRDWVVRAFNENLPLDDFVVWQLAGDLLPSPTLQQKVATGFVRMNPSTSEGGAIPAEFQAKNNFDRTETLGTVLLGMSLTCARCHTHKYDPITQKEYYQLFAFFNSTAENALDGNKYAYGPHVKAPATQGGWDLYRQLQNAASSLVQDAKGAIKCTPQDLADAKTVRAKIAILAGDASAENIQKRASKLLAKFVALEEDFTTTLIAQELASPRETKILHRGEYDQPQGDALTPDVLSAMGSFPPDAPRNRLGLAQWLTSREHPLVARVLVNRIWQRVFGYGLVRTPEDFGLQGQHPTHPELLDWLAVELQESGWDLQHMLRLMVKSRTFQQSSAWRTGVDDPENLLFSRGPSYRLDAEVIRDIALWASGLLDAQMGGEGVKPYQPAGMWKALAHPASNTKKYERDAGQTLYRRSLYVYWKRTSPHPMMTLFDAPDRESSCVRRSRTNTSLQSLGLLNETQRIEMSRKFAARVMAEAKDDRSRLQLVFQLLACRKPNSNEMNACQNSLTVLQKRYADNPGNAKALLEQGDAVPDENLDPAEHSAWTQLIVTLLASDVALVLY